MTVLNQTPSAIQQLVYTLKEIDADPEKLSLRLIVCGGEAFPNHLLDPLLEWNVPVWNFYGPTEATVWAVAGQMKKNKSISMGRPIDNRLIYLLDSHLQPVPVGIPGELHIGGVALARGYLNRPELTKEKFIPNPFSKEESARLYKTGDLARYLPNGEIEFLGRIDHQVKLRGFRIEPEEIETVLTEHKGIREAVVLIREDQPGDKRLVAYIVPDENQAPADQEIQNFLKEILPGYMIPSAFVPLKVLPLTPNGKLDRRSLPAPNLSRKNAGKNYVPPRSELENRLVSIWAEVLGIEQVSIDDNFFELGGHSLLATKAIIRIRNRLNISMKIRNLFLFPTVEKMASFISQNPQEKQTDKLPPLEALVREPQKQLQYKASFSQQRLWILDKLSPDNPFYNIANAVRLQGVLNVNALEKAFYSLLERHESLRTTFITINEQLYQNIQPVEQVNFSIPHIDISDLSPTEAEEKAIAEEHNKPFNLLVGPLIRVKLVKRNDKDYILLLTIHHIVSDGWSMEIIYEELSKLYQAYNKGISKPSLPPIKIQYADFSHWQKKWLEGKIIEKQLCYWRRQLLNLPLLKFPTDKPRPPAQSFRGNSLNFTLDKSLCGKLQKLALEHNTTFFTVMFTAFSVLLARYSNQDDIVIGTPIANRHHEDIEKIIGFFVNTLVLRSDIGGEPTFTKLLERNKTVALDAYDNQDLPFEYLVGELQCKRDFSRNPLFQVLFVLQNQIVNELKLDNISVEDFGAKSKISKFDLTLEILETNKDIKARFEYSSDLFDHSSIVRLSQHFQLLLEEVVGNPNRKVCRLPILTSGEKTQLLTEWNNTAVELPVEKTIHQLFEEQVQKTPNNIAVKFHQQSFTYKELNNQANQIAHYLRKKGVKPGSFVGICVERSLDTVIGILGILKAGGAYVPIDPIYPNERMDYILEDSGANIILTQEKLSKRLMNSGCLSEKKRHLVVMDSARKVFDKEKQVNPVPFSKPSDIAYIIYTSGSTGKPKGVLIPNSNVVRLLRATDDEFAFSQEDVWPLFHSFSFDVSVWELWGSLLKGGKLIVIPRELSQAPEDFYQLLLDEQVTVLNQTPSAFYQLINIHTDKPGDSVKLSLRLVIFADEALDMKKLKPWTQKQGFEKPRLVNMYGITETTVHVTVHIIKENDVESGVGSIGRAMSDLKTYVLDKNLQLVPTGVVGEMCVAGPGLAKGYLNLPDYTKEKFVQNPFTNDPDAKLYRSGDLVRWQPDGVLEYIGRADDQIKIRGFRVELGEIESKLLEHPSISQTIVVLRNQDSAEKELAAYFVAKESEKRIEPNQLNHFLKKYLPDYMLPKTFTQMDKFTLTPNGKINKKALPAPEFDQLAISTSYVAPSSPEEKGLAEIWAEVLGADSQKIGIHDNYFELGGNSLMVTSLVSKINAKFPIDLHVRDIFIASTIADISQLIYQKTGSAQSNSNSKIRNVNFDLEAILPSDIYPEKTEFQFPNNPTAIFLTGANGFVGGYLLHELLKKTKADIYCLVRGANVEECKNKIINGLKQKLVWEDELSPRIKALKGDLSKPLLGLSKEEFQKMANEIDVIYHNGASVNFLYPYEELKAPNVLGTQEIIKLACLSKLKPIHYNSTLALFSSSGLHGIKFVKEDTPIDYCDELYMGYVETKWISEKLFMEARKRGVPVCLYRFLEVTGHSETGVFNTKSLEAAFWKGCYRLGRTEDLRMQKSYAPVDYIAKSVVHLSMQEKSMGLNFHLHNPTFTTNKEVNDIIRSLGYPFKEIGYAEWIDLILKHPKNAFFLYSPLITERWTKDQITTLELYTLDRLPQFDCSNTLSGLKGSGIACTELDRDYIGKCWSYLKSIGYLDE